LFGHEKGSFTGALARRKGKLELADGGTLFLDEVAEISPKVQVELLRALEDKKVVRVGGSQEIAVDFRVICATNRDLDQVVRDGGFREDLYYRIHVFVIEIPPLRERREDILPVAEHFLARFAESMARKVTGFSEAAKQALMRYSWPGNVRELANAVERALVVCRSGEILPEHLPIGVPSAEAAGTEPGPSGRTLREVERQHIQRVLAEQDYNISHAAKLLGIDRVTLYNKMRRYEIQRPE
jgi:DNA-binding NtrC family response regulator